ncbi:uncharacterized protein DS421_19g651840 [Arachis hypogaea]|uniref:Uncharacterized protein n=1 Tax=Arachis hypogaea TaxID=3818 RepID=A0A6B9V8W3_ARAHY|nr:uncharacterized protein DS421_19g651840 [Arachis hypogaea]
MPERPNRLYSESSSSRFLRRKPHSSCRHSSCRLATEPIIVATEPVTVYLHSSLVVAEPITIVAEPAITFLLSPFLLGKFLKPVAAFLLLNLFFLGKFLSLHPPSFSLHHIVSLLI